MDFYKDLKKVYTKKCVSDLKQLKGIDIVEEYRKFVEWDLNKDNCCDGDHKQVSLEQIQSAINRIEKEWSESPKDLEKIRLKKDLDVHGELE